MKYKAVIFDLFGTLVDNYPQTISNNILMQMASVLSAPVDDFIASWYTTFDDRMKGRFKSYQACIRHICQQLRVDTQDYQIERAAGIRSNMARQELTSPRYGALDVLSHLKSNGQKTGLISNCSTETTIIWKETSLAPLIDTAIFSCLVEIMKPDPRIYQIAMDKLVVNPKECLYIADGIGQELASASNLGMYAILIRVPYDGDYDSYRAEWDGSVISSLTEVLALV